MSVLPINLQVMIKGLYDTTVEFFALRNPTPPPDGPSLGRSNSDQRTLTPVPNPIERLTRECASLQEQLDAVDRGSGESDLSPMRRGLENVTNQLARSQAEVAKLEERCRMLEKALRGTREMLEARETELEHLRKVGRMSEKTLEDDQRGQARSGPQNMSPRNETKAGSSSMLFDEHRAQTRSNEVYMTRTDSWSGAQVIQAVHDLNSEIIQFAASATELCAFDSNGPSSSQAMHDTSARLGPNLAGLLPNRERNSQDPTLVGLALQAGIATCIARALSTFALGLPSKTDVILSQVYSHVFMAGKVRVIDPSTDHKSVHALYPGLAEYAAEELKETICRWTSDILVAACAAPEATSRAWVRETFGEQVGRMVKAVAGIAQICRQEIMSTNFDLVLIEPGQSFDERMLDAFGEYGVSHGAVVATTELGLRRMTRRGVPGREEDRTVEQQLLVRPKVILDSVGTTFN